MGYRIGSQCFETKAAATDYQMSLVIPTIAADGSLLHPVKQNDQWQFAGQAVQLSFGDCNPMADFKAGAEISGAFIALMALAWGIRFLVRFVLKLGEMSDKDD